MLAKFRNTGSVADAHKGRHRSWFGIIPENMQNLRERLEESPRKLTRRLSQETVISRTSVLRIFHDDVKLFPYKILILRGKLIKIKQKEKSFVNLSVRRLKMTLDCWISTI